MATIDEVTAEVSAESAKLDTLNAQIKAMNDRPAPGLPAELQAKIDALSAALADNKVKLEAALAASLP